MGEPILQKHKGSGTMENEQRAFANETRPELKRDTAFLCPVGFNNQIPPVPFEWKLLRVLEQQIAIPGDDHDELKKGLVLSADLGITLNQILPNKHQAADVASLAHSADAAIITEKYGSHAASGDMSNSKSKKPDLSKALWLMNTQYISSMTLPEHLGRSEKDWAKVRQNIGNENIFCANPRKSQLASINHSFDAAIGTPIHEKHPRLSATKILPVLPDFSRCEQSNVRFTFDEDPENENYKALGTRPGRVEDSLAKPYSAAGIHAEARVEKFVTLFVPGNSVTTHKESVSEDYHWFREYQYNLHHDRSGALRTLCLFFDEKGRTVEYVDLKSKLLLRKRSKRASDHLAVPDIRPCGVTVKRTLSNSDDTRRRQKTRCASSMM